MKGAKMKEQYPTCQKCEKEYAVFEIENNEQEPATKILLCRLCATGKQ